eukprot:s2289_g7.t1
MTSLLDSTAHFNERCTRLGLTPAFVTALGSAGVTCLSRLAFVVGQPGQAIQNTDVDNFLQRALGRAGTIAESSSLKRLTFEAHTYLFATLRQQVDHTEDSQPRKVAFAERTQRMEALRTDLRGVEISGELEPSHGLLDRACAMRAVALAFARVMSFQQHCAWETFLFESLHREVPPGYARANLSQVVSCDKAAWARLATLNTPVREAADGSFPLGEGGAFGQASASLIQCEYTSAGSLPTFRTSTTGWKR